MNDQAANRMLKTLEEPPSFAHLLLLTDRREDVLATIVSRCQQVVYAMQGPQAVVPPTTWQSFLLLLRSLQ